MNFDELAEFKRDLKALSKRYRTLHEDLNVVKMVLETCIIKVKKIACKSLKGRGVNSGLRLIYAYFKEEQRIVFIELYHKNEDRIVVEVYFSSTAPRK
ncbi:MAG: hypothetical protein WCX48_04475 [Bacteroidales bacterium]